MGYKLWCVVGADGDEDRVTELIASGRKKHAAESKKFAERKKLAVAALAKTKKKEKVEAKGESDDVSTIAASYVFQLNSFCSVFIEHVLTFSCCRYFQDMGFMNLFD